MSHTDLDPTGQDIDPDTDERDDAIIAVALRRSLIVLIPLMLAGGAAAWWMTRPAPPPKVQRTELAAVDVREAPPLELPSVPFTDITDEAGIDFHHENGAAGGKLLPETMGGGCAFFDFDADGDQDLALVNSQRWPWDSGSDPQPAGVSLYANDGSGSFTNVTKGSGLEAPLYGMGVAAGDYDGDGRVDLFITAVGPSRLFHNEGAGKFLDVTAQAGVAGKETDWGTSCGWFDYDRDGDLDLFVCNYLVWSRAYDAGQNFQLTGGGRAYGRPQNFEGTFPYLYRNEGAGKFTDVTAAAGLHVRNPATDVPMAKSLGVIFPDVDADGWPDIVVANDTVQNFLFHNQQDGSFQEVGALAGIAFDMDGNARGAMGVDAAHFRNDDSLGVAIGNFANEMNALYVTEGARLLFMDEAISSGLGPSSRLQLTFGLCFLDVDLDGRLDIFSANGHLEDEINRVQPSQHYEQPPQLFWNCGKESDTEFTPLTEVQYGEAFGRPLVGRGAAYADIDADGDLDLLVTTVGQKPRLLRNDQKLGHHWLRVRLKGAGGNRDAIGAMVEVSVKGRTFRQSAAPTRSYLSQVELPVTFGLGGATEIDSVRIHWPDGDVQTIDGPPVDRELVVEQAPN